MYLNLKKIEKLISKTVEGQRKTSSGGGMKICENAFGHMIKMAATPIYGKTF